VPNDYAKIQWAVDNASANDTIIVRDAIYVENKESDRYLHQRFGNSSGEVDSAMMLNELNDKTANITSLSNTVNNINDYTLTKPIGLYEKSLAQAVNPEWSTPQTIVGAVPWWVGGDNPSIAFDSDGVWHMVYSWIDDDHTYYLTYKNSAGSSYHIVQGKEEAMCPSIAVDPNGGLHVVYRSSLGSIKYTTKEAPSVPVLLVHGWQLKGGFNPSELWKKWLTGLQAIQWVRGLVI